MARRIYENPPIKEVVCEIRFSQNTQWDPTIPGIVFEKLKNDFPIREVGKDIQTEISFENDNVNPKVRLNERAILRNNEGNMLVQVGVHLLAINHLTPYTSWDNYLKVIDTALSVYSETTEEATINRIELRYINEILLSPEDILKLDEYFDFYPHVGYRMDFNSFSVGVQTQYGDDIQRIQMFNTQSSVILDSSYFTGIPNNIEKESVIPWLENAHDKNNQAFEGSIKPKLRNKFRVVD